jgi:hypothetical protein
MGILFFTIWAVFSVWYWFVIFRDPNDPDNPKFKETV